MSSITDKVMVLVTRIGNVWVTKERGQNAMNIKEQDPNAIIEIDEGYYSANQIVGLLTAQQFDNYQKERRGLWNCPYQKWHGRNDDCTCARDQYKPPAPRARDMTDEERAKARAKLDEIKKRFGKNNEQKSNRR